MITLLLIKRNSSKIITLSDKIAVAFAMLIAIVLLVIPISQIYNILLVRRSRKQYYEALKKKQAASFEIQVNQESIPRELLEKMKKEEKDRQMRAD
jgi:hypothetical protein